MFIFQTVTNKALNTSWETPPPDNESNFRPFLLDTPNLWKLILLGLR